MSPFVASANPGTTTSRHRWRCWRPSATLTSSTATTTGRAGASAGWRRPGPTNRPWSRRRTAPVSQLPQLHVGARRRAYAWSHDGGLSFPRTGYAEGLPEPICHASVLRFTGPATHDRNRVLFSNPASATRRERLTVRLSYDECRTWNAGKVVYEDHAAYSDLCVAPDLSICCLFDHGRGTGYDGLFPWRASIWHGSPTARMPSRSTVEPLAVYSPGRWWEGTQWRGGGAGCCRRALA